MNGLASASPKELIPGEPEELRALAAMLRGHAGAAAQGARGLRGLDGGLWIGEAADRFRSKLGELPEKLERGVESFETAATAVVDYADELSNGQRAVVEAIGLAQQAEREDRVYQDQVHEYNAAVQAGVTGLVPPPTDNPAAATMAGAVKLLERIRARVEDAAERSAARLRQEAEQAPSQASLLGDIVDQAGEFFAGAGEAIWETGDFVFRLTSQLFVDPKAWATAWTELASGVAYAVTHPVDFAEEVVDWESFKENPARAIGGLAVGALLTGGAARVVRGVRGSARLAAIPRWMPEDAARKVPDTWGPGRPNRQGIGHRWEDPSNQGNGVRIDKGNRSGSYATQQVDHVIVRSNGKVIGRDGQPIPGSIREYPELAHIPLKEWRKWESWNHP